MLVQYPCKPWQGYLCSQTRAPSIEVSTLGLGVASGLELTSCHRGTSGYTRNRVIRSHCSTGSSQLAKVGPSSDCSSYSCGNGNAAHHPSCGGWVPQGLLAWKGGPVSNPGVARAASSIVSSTFVTSTASATSFASVTSSASIGGISGKVSCGGSLTFSSLWLPGRHAESWSVGSAHVEVGFLLRGVASMEVWADMADTRPWLSYAVGH